MPKHVLLNPFAKHAGANRASTKPNKPVDARILTEGISGDDFFDGVAAYANTGRSTLIALLPED